MIAMHASRARAPWLTDITLWVLLGVLLTLGGGCVSTAPRPVSDPFAFTPEERRLVESLGHFGQGLLAEVESGRSSAEAFDHFLKALELAPAVESLHSKVAVGYLYRELPEKAIATLKLACVRNPRSLRARLNLATTCELTDHVEEALEHYRAALELAPDKTGIHLAIGRLYFRQKQDARALDALRRGIRTVDEPAPLLVYVHNQAQDYAIKGELHRAIACFKLLAEEAPGQRAGLLVRLADLYRQTGNGTKADEAIAEARGRFQEAVDNRPAEPQGYLALADLLFREDADAQALELLAKGVEEVEDPAPLVAYSYAQGKQLIEESHPQRAVACFEFLAKHTREKQADIYYLLGQLHEALKAPDQAEQALRKAIEIDPSMDEAYLRLARMRFESDPQQAIRILTDANRRLTNSAPVLHMLGELYDHVDRTNNAVRFFSLATEAESPLPESFARLALIQARTNLPAAVHTLERAREESPGRVEILYPLARIYSASELHEEAIGVYERISGLITNMPGRSLRPYFYLNYGAACERAGRKEDAERVFEECLTAYPEAHEVLNYLAYMWAEDGVKLSRALQYVKRALVAEPENGAYVDTLGWVYYKQGRYEAALEQIRRAAELIPDDPTILDHLGDIYLALERTEEAVASWRRSYALDPENETVAAKLAEQGIRIEPPGQTPERQEPTPPSTNKTSSAASPLPETAAPQP